MLHHPSLTAIAAAPLPVTALFEEFLPKIMQVRGDACRALGGCIAIQLRDDRAYTVDLSRARLVEGIAADAGVVLSLSRADLAALMHGKLDVAAAAAEPGRIHCSGDASLLLRLALLLRPQGFGKPPRKGP